MTTSPDAIVTWGLQPVATPDSRVTRGFQSQVAPVVVVVTGPGLVVVVTGVWDDGSRRRTGVPFDTRQPLAIARGADLDVEVYLITPSGAGIELDLDGDDQIQLAIRDQRGRQRARRLGTAADAPGRYRIRLLPDDTDIAQTVTLAYDVWVRRAGRTQQVVGLSSLRLRGRAVDRTIEP